MLELVGLIVFSYLIGSISPAYLAGRLAGRDLTREGSGNPGGANVFVSVDRRLVVPIGILEVLKGLGPVALARLLGQDIAGQLVVGVAALVGHNWSIFLRFKGGRGTGVILGVLILPAPAQLVVFATCALAGFLLRLTPLGVLVGLALLPLSALFLDQGTEVALPCTAILAVVLVKRLLANGPPPRWVTLRNLVVYRALFDRDIASREQWIRPLAGDKPADS
ncbi:MAG: glycerol-3-phosphate acyltransferase [Dehalococcoidia bacterium]